MRLLRGRVESGEGSFGIWIARLREHYARVTGLQLFPGTLNLRLEQEYHRPADFLRLEAAEYGGAVSVSLIPCRIFGRRAFILRTDKAEFDAQASDRFVIEVATDVKLRSVLGLQDGDWVEVEVE